jgi:hypothetical protein
MSARRATIDRFIMGTPFSGLFCETWRHTNARSEDRFRYLASMAERA